MRGTLLVHPVNGVLVYSPDVWVDPSYAVLHPNGRFSFTPASRSMIDRFPSIPQAPGESVAVNGDPLILTHQFASLPPFP